MTLFSQFRRWLLHRTTRNGAVADAMLERVVTDAALRLQDARAEMQICETQEYRLATLEAEEGEREARALEAAREHLALNRMAQAREAAARAVRARQHAEMYRAQRMHMRDSRRRLEELAEAMAMKLTLLEHQRQLLQARRQLTLARESLTKGLGRGADDSRLELMADAAFTDELAAEAYQELVADDAVPIGDTVEQVLDRLQHDLPSLPGNQDSAA